MQGLENKQSICTYLTWALQDTRNLGDLASLNYDEEREIVDAIFWSDGQMKRKKEINVEADSGIAMMKDIIRALE